MKGSAMKKSITVCISLVIVLMMTSLGFTKQSAKAGKVPNDVVIGLLRAMIRDKQIDKSCVDGEKDKASIIDVKAVDLNNDGIPEFWIAGNAPCAFGARTQMYWVYGKSGDNYRMLLSAGALDDMKVGNAVSKGYKDIVGMYLSGAGTVKEKVLFKYDGNIYKQAR
jgi:hypothetical protein